MLLASSENIEFNNKKYLRPYEIKECYKDKNVSISLLFNHKKLDKRSKDPMINMTSDREKYSTFKEYNKKKSSILFHVPHNRLLYNYKVSTKNNDSIGGLINCNYPKSKDDLPIKLSDNKINKICKNTNVTTAARAFYNKLSFSIS